MADPWHLWSVAWTADVDRPSTIVLEDGGEGRLGYVMFDYRSATTPTGEGHSFIHPSVEEVSGVCLQDRIESCHLDLVLFVDFSSRKCLYGNGARGFQVRIATTPVDTASYS